MIMIISNGKVTRKMTGEDLRQVFMHLLDRNEKRKTYLEHIRQMNFLNRGRRLLAAGKDGIESALTA
jgi:hypothetical protein